METVAVISASDKKLMPTNSYRARKLLKKGRAVVYKYRPVFTIRLLDREDGETQPMEYCCDTGYQHIGVSVKSRKHEYVNRQYDLLSDETEHHNDCRKYRRDRRNRKTRYREARWNNRKSLICKDGFAPSIRNKRDRHVDLFYSFYEVMPVTSAVFEMGQFDTQVLKAMEEGKPLPQGTDYQQGERYGIATLREAVFTRDGYQCIVCKKTPFKDHIVLHVHHVGFWKGDRTNRMGNLATVGSCCHTPKNHKPGGKLYGLNPKLKPFKGATFMTMVRYSMFRQLQETALDVEFYMTYGAATKQARKMFRVKKSHSNDAYCMGEFHPRHRTDFKAYKKRRRNNRVLCKFYDAKYIDIRDESKKSGSQLSCNRTNRSIPRNNSENLRIYHGQKISKGRYSIRRKHPTIQSGDIILYKNKKYLCNGVITNGTYVTLNGLKKTPSVKDVKVYKHASGWKEVTAV